MRDRDSERQRSGGRAPAEVKHRARRRRRDDPPLIAELHGTARVPLARLLRAPAAFDPRNMEVDVSLQVPARRLGKFPSPLRFAGVDGSMRAQGRLGRPELCAHVELLGLRLNGSRRARPLAIIADAQLDGDQLSANVAVRDEQQKRMSVPAQATVAGRAGLGLRSLNLEVRSNGLPLDAVGALLGYDAKCTKGERAARPDATGADVMRWYPAAKATGLAHHPGTAGS